MQCVPYKKWMTEMGENEKGNMGTAITFDDGACVLVI